MRWWWHALLLLLLGALAAATATAQSTTCPPLPMVDSAPARDRGLLWKLTRDGRVSYLFGTLHIGRPGWQRFGPRTAAALAQTDVLALELDPADPANSQGLATPAGEAPTAALPQPLAARLQRALDRGCLPAAALSALHPMLQATLLSISEARWLGLDPAYSQEVLLGQAARATGRSVVALETLGQQRDALLSAGTGDDLALIDEALAQLESGATRRALKGLVAAWQRGDLAALERVEAWCECAPGSSEREQMRLLNDARNPALADGIAALHGAGNNGQRVFAAVGALHMTGAMSLPRLLAQRGFAVERVHFAR